MPALDAAAVSAVDATGQLRELLDLPEHLLDALWRVESAAIQRGYSEGGLVLAGTGGTGAGASLARAVLRGRERRPIVPVTDGTLPRWVDGTWSVLLSSYSGATPETLTAWEAASRSGARRIVTGTGGPLVERAREAGAPVIPVPGGFAPRHAIGYWTVIALEAARLCGAAPPLADEVTAAAESLRALREPWGADGPQDADPKQLARALAGGTIPVIYGAGPTVAVAARLKAQINVNAGRPAFAAALPAARHDELEGWGGGVALAPVLLVDPEATDATTLAAFDAVDRAAGGGAVRVEATGAGAAERVLRLTWLVDLASVYLAVLGGTDPASTPRRDASAGE